VNPYDYQILPKGLKMKLMKICDLVDPSDKKKRTYREINLSKNHNHSIAELVEISGGARLFVVRQSRDCDGTPLYSLSHDPWSLSNWIHGFSEDVIKSV